MLKLDLATDCLAGESLTPIDEAFTYFASLPDVVSETESIPVSAAVGRVLARDVATAISLPPFDHSAVDGFGVSESDLDREPPFRLRMTGRLVAGATRDLPLQEGETIRLLTGAAILVNFMLFGRSMISAAAGLAIRRPLGQAALTTGDFRHSSGRTEFVPVRAIGSDQAGRPIVEKLGKGGSARLRPLVLADGLAELPEDQSDLPPDSPIAFHAFKAAFAP